MIADLASLATAFGVLAAVLQLGLTRRQGRASFEHEFVTRYWTIADQRLEEAGPDDEAGQVPGSGVTADPSN